MIRRHVLAAVALGVEAGDDDVARAELGRIDWVLRGRARRRLEHALIDAALATGVIAPATPDDTRHVLRAAALIVAGRRDVELADRARVAAAHRAAAPLRFPIATIAAAVVGLAIAGVVAAVAVAVVTAHDPPGRYTRPARAAPVGAFRDGGVPVRDPAIERVLAVELPRLVVAHDAGERRRRAIELRAHPAFAMYGPLAAAWRAMIDLDLGDVDPRELRTRVDVVSDELAAAGLGYYLDSEMVGGHAGIFTYRIEDIAVVRAADDRVRVLELRRLDRIAITLALLGMKPEQMGDPVVLLDQVDDHVATQVVPVLDGAPYTLADDGWDHTPRGRAATAAAGDAIRRELTVALGAEPDVVGRLRKLVAASVRHHEAQHGFDADHRLAAPAVLAGLTGPFAVRARAELSAYTSQIASDPWLPQLALWNLARHGFRASRSSPEALAAAIVVVGIARHLGIAEPAPVVHDGVIDRDRLAALVAPLAARSTSEIRTAAAALWTEIFDEKLARIVDDRWPS